MLYLHIIFSFILFPSRIVSMSGLHGDGILNMFFFFLFFCQKLRTMWNFELSFQALFRYHTAKEQMKQRIWKAQSKRHNKHDIRLQKTSRLSCATLTWIQRKKHKKRLQNFSFTSRKSSQSNAQRRCTHANNSKCWTNWITASHIFPVL